jgi:hypothetical protein
MATTTNYGWTTPNDTDLVKDGAAAIRTLGSSVDTTTKALNPSTTLGDIEYRSATANTNTRLPIGTTGQILSVVAGVPSWVANDVGDITAVSAGTGISGGGTSGDITITNSMATIIDAKGDLIVGTGADAFARLAVGTNGQVLTADSSEATGLKFATPSAGGGGKVLQVVQGTLTGYANTSSTSYATTGLTQNITPSSATSKVLVMVNLSSAVKNAGNAATALQVKLLRGATEISFAGDNIGHTAVNDKNNFGSVAFSYLDSPATTSATTYVVHFASKTSGQEVGINDYTASNTAVSSIVLLEIGA